LAKQVSDLAFTERISEVVILGGNTTSVGFLQPLWPFEFNLTKDRPAFRTVFNSALPLTFIPLNVAREMRVSWRQAAALRGDLGGYLASGAERWFRRARIYQLAKTVPVWDLVAAAYCLWPELCRVSDRNAHIDWSGRIRWTKSGKRATKVVTEVNTSEIWRRFEEVIGSFCESSAEKSKE
jgi:inosine-uridine nucleoside N-ribohydrolase